MKDIRIEAAEMYVQELDELILGYANSEVNYRLADITAKWLREEMVKVFTFCRFSYECGGISREEYASVHKIYRYIQDASASFLYQLNLSEKEAERKEDENIGRTLFDGFRTNFPTPRK